MKRITAVALALMLAAAPCAGARADTRTALEAFNALLADDEAGQAASKTAELWLDEIMAGAFETMPTDAGALEALAADLEPLSGITDRDIAAFASDHGLAVAQVRNAWFKALANALAADIELNPASGEKYRNAQMILSLFLEADAVAGDAAARRDIRAGMTPESSRRLAEQAGLPAQFVAFVIMDENWRDASWENDDDWRDAAGWAGLGSDDFDDVAIGSRDSDGSTRIADMQAMLISLGYLKGKADGVFGPRTQAALLEFQLANGLKATGAYAASDRDRLLSDDAVARWDYGGDFWDSDDFDSYRTPRAGDTDSGDTPDRDGDTPDTPQKRSAPKQETPDTLDTPKRDSGRQGSSRRDTPDSPDSDD